MPASTLKPYGGAEPSLREARGFKVNAGHADEKVAGSQTRHHRQIQGLIKQPFTNGGRDCRREPLQCQSRQGERQQRSMAGGRKAETYGPRFRNVGIEIHRIAERIQFTREIENVEAPGRRDRDTKFVSSSPHDHPHRLSRHFRFGLCVNGGNQ